MNPTCFDPELTPEYDLPAPIEVCWFCKRHAAKAGCEYQCFLYKVFSKKAGRRPFPSGHQAVSALIPRCARCNVLHRAKYWAGKIIALGVGYTVLLISAEWGLPVNSEFALAMVATVFAALLVSNLLSALPWMENKAWDHRLARQLHGKLAQSSRQSSTADDW